MNSKELKECNWELAWCSYWLSCHAYSLSIYVSMNKRKKRNRGAQQIPFSILSPFADSAYFPYTRKAPPKSDFQLGVFTPGTASPPNFVLFYLPSPTFP